MERFPNHDPRRQPLARGRGRGRGFFMGAGRGQPPNGYESESEESIRIQEEALEQAGKHLKLEIPDFSRSLNPGDLLEWIRDVEKIFEFKNYNDAKRLREGKEPIKSWSKLKKKLLDKFVTKDYTQDLFIKLSKLRQDERPLETYLREVEQLTLQCEINEKPEKRIARFLEGLDKNIATKVRMQPLWSYDDVVNFALRVEKMGKSKPAPPKPKPVYRPYTGVKIVETPKPVSQAGGDKGKAPMFPKSNPPLTKEKIKCFQCKGYGHSRKDCPSKRALITMEVEEWERKGSVEYEEEPVIEETALEEEPSQKMVMAHHDIGHSLDRVCNLIINGGSCTNVASVTMVNKLKLSNQKHPNAYKLRWLNKGAEVKGRSNTYSFKQGSRKITLTPLPPNQKNYGSPSVTDGLNEVLFPSEAEMVKEMQQEQHVLILLSKDIHEDVEHQLPAEVRPLLEQYQDAFPAELPSGFPTLRGIKHQIDLVPRSVLPNRPGYRCDPDATRELHKQIDELMNKGFVRESLSPCVVPALLVPKKDGTWRMCIDSRAINNIIVKYRFPIPRLDDMLDELSGARIFSKIDLRQGYHQVRIREGDEWNTAFKTKQGLYECKVTEKHLSHLEKLLKILRGSKLFGKLEKCTFLASEIKFLGYIISGRGISVD
ncbi:uncharacterized protein LOC141618956 [Silene latifolia]|uniref:uncharacterized protein LOC141618956 n=1 Tax=Silene latifolia TaxID=37657 RepID=UPI003D7891F2